MKDYRFSFTDVIFIVALVIGILAVLAGSCSAQTKVEHYNITSVKVSLNEQTEYPSIIEGNCFIRIDEPQAVIAIQVDTQYQLLQGVVFIMATKHSPTSTTYTCSNDVGIKSYIEVFNNKSKVFWRGKDMVMEMWVVKQNIPKDSMRGKF